MTQTAFAAFMGFLREVFIGKPSPPAIEEDRYPVDAKGRPDLTRFTKPAQHYASYIDVYLQSLTSSTVRDAATQSLAYRKYVFGQWGLIARGPRDAMPYVLRLLEHSVPEGRSAAAGVLDHWAKDSTIVQHLLEALAIEQDIETISILADTLARLKVREALPRLAQLMRAPDASTGDLDWNLAGAISRISGENFGDGRDRIAAADSWLRSKGY